MKKPSTKVLWLSVGGSLGLHAILFVAWLTYDKLNPENTALQAKLQTHTINIQLLTEAQAQQTAINKLLPQTALNKTESIAKHNKPATKPQPQETTASKSVTSDTKTSLSAQTTEQDFDALYELLYNAINQHKRYPIAALRLQQQGKVRVAFKLLNNGNLNSIEVSESSGYNALDKAALLAVKHIQPFYPAADFIASVKGFQVDIIFQL